MVTQSYLIRLAAVAAVATVVNAAPVPKPLNINLGAYSPALVVGDGAIGFEGGQNVEQLMSTLQGSAVNQAARVAGANGAARQVAAPAAPVPQAPTQASVAPGILNEQATLPIPGSNKELDPRDHPEVQGEAAAEDEDEEEEPATAPKVEKRQNAGFDRALTFAEAALTKSPKVQLGTGEKGSGVGIIVENAPAAGARPAGAKP